jgi:hypothetical protein
VPEERRDLQKNLHIFTKAAANLYGAISKADLASTCNKDYATSITPNDLRTLLLPLVIESQPHCFYKEQVVHKCAIADFGYADRF